MKAQAAAGLARTLRALLGQASRAGSPEAAGAALAEIELTLQREIASPLARSTFAAEIGLPGLFDCIDGREGWSKACIVSASLVAGALLELLADEDAGRIDARPVLARIAELLDTARRLDTQQAQGAAAHRDVVLREFARAIAELITLAAAEGQS